MTAMIRATAAGLAILSAVSLAHAVDGPQPITQYETPAEARWAPFSSDLPSCGDTGVLNALAARFNQTESTYWGGKAAISGYDEIREIGFRANGLAYIPRRYCVARAAIDDPRTNGKVEAKHTVVYSVVAAGGILGVSWGVEWCVNGFDRNHAYSPDCAILRPILERWLGEPKTIKQGLTARY